MKQQTNLGLSLVFITDFSRRRNMVLISDPRLMSEGGSRANT